MKYTRPQTKGLSSESVLSISVNSTPYKTKEIYVMNYLDYDLRFEVHDGCNIIQGQMLKSKSEQRACFTDEWVNKLRDPWIKLMNHNNKVEIELQLLAPF